MTIHEKLMCIQKELKAPKNMFNKFGGYKYRNFESICEAVKELEDKYKVCLTVSDTLEQIGDRYYIKAVATLYDTESAGMIVNTAFAREPEDKKGMDASQITGTTSSYARKYACNGLFLIDDTKDADTDEFKVENSIKSGELKPTDLIGKEMIAELNDMIKGSGDKEKQKSVYEFILKQFEVEGLKDMTVSQYMTLKNKFDEVVASAR